MLDSGHERRRRGGIPRFPRSTLVRSARPSTLLRPASTPAKAGYCLPASAAPSLGGWLSAAIPALSSRTGVLSATCRRSSRAGTRASGRPLMHRLREVTRDEMGLEQLHLAVRGGMGLEDFYSRLGWRVTGRWPGKLRLAPDDTRDEILMILTPL